MFRRQTFHEISLAYGGTLVLTTAVSDEELEVQACKEGPETRHGSENDLGCD